MCLRNGFRECSYYITVSELTSSLRFFNFGGITGSGNDCSCLDCLIISWQSSEIEIASALSTNKIHQDTFSCFALGE